MRSSSSITPRGVHGSGDVIGLLTLSTSRPRFVGCRPSASFVRIDALEDRVGVDVLRQRQLHDVAVARRVGVELVDQRLDVGLGRVGGQLALDRVHPDRLGLPVLHADVQLRRRVGADEHRGDARDDAPLLERRDALASARP